jgi:acyl carrier protein
VELNSEKINKIVDDILNDRFEVPREKLVPTALLKDDLRLDSLDFVDMMVVLEEKIGGTIPDFNFASIQTLGDIYKLVDQIAGNTTKD